MSHDHLAPEGLVPEAADVDPGHLRCTKHLAQAPHERTVHPHQLLVIHHVRLVQHDPDLVVVAPQRLDAAPELVTDVQLVGVKQQQNPEKSGNDNLTFTLLHITSTYLLPIEGGKIRQKSEIHAISIFNFSLLYNN